MCCLKYEEDTYEYLNSKLPNVGDSVKTFDGLVGEVADVNVLRQTVRIVVTDEEGNKEAMDYKVSELKFKPRRRHRHDNNEKHGKKEDSELEALEALEKNDGKSGLD